MGLVFHSDSRFTGLIVAASHPDAARSVFVTGATGFVGTHLCRVLTRRGWQVQAAIRLGGAALEIPGVGSTRLELFCEPLRWQAAMRGCQGVVHLAAHVHQMRADARAKSEYDRINVDGSLFVAEQALQAGVQRFVFLSSIKVNGECADRPYRSGDAPQPRDAYGRSKWAAEQRLAELCANSRMGLAIIRPPLVYGPGVRANFRRFMRLASLGMPLPVALIANRRSFLGVANLVDFIAICLTHPAFAGTWLVSDGKIYRRRTYWVDSRNSWVAPRECLAYHPSGCADWRAPLGSSARLSG